MNCIECGETEGVVVRPIIPGGRTTISLCKRCSRLANSRTKAHLPYGLRREGGKIVLNGPEQDAIALIKSMYLNNLSLRQMASILTDRGLPCRGRAWYPAAIQRIGRSNMEPLPFLEQLRVMGACKQAQRWVGTRDLKTAWAECMQPEWMLWWLMATGTKWEVLLVLIANEMGTCGEPWGTQFLDSIALAISQGNPKMLWCPEEPPQPVSSSSLLQKAAAQVQNVLGSDMKIGSKFYMIMNLSHIYGGRESELQAMAERIRAYLPQPSQGPWSQS